MVSNTLRIIIFVLFCFITSTSIANEYRVVRVVDGDTIEIEAKFLPKELGRYLKLRIEGIDTPESGGRAKCLFEANLAAEAKRFVEELIANSKNISVSIKKWDKYGGRVIGDLLIDEESLGKILIDLGFAVSYEGKGRKKNWCNL